MATIRQVENALFQYLAPVATSINCKLELLPADYFEKDGEASALRNRHAFIVTESKRYDTPANKGLTSSYAQKIVWKMKIACLHKELRTHQGLWDMAETFENALAGVKITPETGPVYITNIFFRKIEENTVWVCDVNFEFVEHKSYCSNLKEALINV